MISLRKAAEQHRDSFYALLTENGETVTVRQAAAKPASGGNDVTKMLGQRPSTSAQEIGATKDVTAIVSGPSGTGSPSAPGVASQVPAVGMLAGCDLVLRVKLSDVLVDTAKPYGKTLFDTAKDIQVQGSGFKVEGVERGGLAPVGPYILWVGLKALGS